MTPLPKLLPFLIPPFASLAWGGDHYGVGITPPPPEFSPPSDDNGGLQWFFGADLEAVFWATDSPAAGLLRLDDGDHEFFAPRLSLRADALLNSHWFFHSNLRVDRGFDPADKPDGEIRLDELLLRYRPFGDQRLNLQAGKFATVFGSWVEQHDFHDDPFLTPPLAYGQILGIPVRGTGPLEPDHIRKRATGDEPGVFETSKDLWASTIWGPSYTTGFSAFGTINKFDYAFEVKNAGLSSQPDIWNASSSDFDDPSFSGRLGYRPNAAWALGVSFSRGPYLNPDVDPGIGISRGDLPQTLLGLDARWSYRDFIFSGEIIASEFQTLNSGDLRSLSWYLQARWKASPQLWFGTRIAQTLNNQFRDTDGARFEWSPDLWRAEVSMGWRITPDLLFKSQYGYTHTDSDLPGPGEHFFSSGFGWRF